MNLGHILQALASDAHALALGTRVRCEAANFRWEEGVSASRSAEYEAYVGDVTAHADWRAEHKGYVSSFVHVAKDLPRSAECFLALNVDAHLREDLDDTYLLRLESIAHLSDPLVSGIAESFWRRFFNSQKDLRKTKLADDAEALRSEFTAQWNAHRIQARPMFATFLNDFGGNIETVIKDDWPHRMRDRLGLTHWPSTPGNPLPVVLICYTLEEARQARIAASKKGAVASFVRPTVLDAEMSAAFVPAPLIPGGESYGHTLDLASTGIPGAFTPELLTFPIEYKPQHIKALGFITRDHVLQTDEHVLAARNYHVQGLQALPNRSDFGEVLT